MPERAKRSLLTPKQTKAVAAILEYPTMEAAATAAGVSSKSISRWMAQPVFKAELARAEGALLDGLSRRLLALGDKALDALEDVMDNPARLGAGNKRMAASDILSRILTVRELVTLEQRIKALEDTSHAS